VITILIIRKEIYKTFVIHEPGHRAPSLDQPRRSPSFVSRIDQPSSGGFL
jgi:hypothetical protein